MSNQHQPQCYMNQLNEDDSESDHAPAEDDVSTFSLTLRDGVHSRRSNLDGDDDVVAGEPLLARTASCPNLNVPMRRTKDKRKLSDHEDTSDEGASSDIGFSAGVQRSVHNARGIMDNAVNTALEIGHHAEETIHHAIDKVDQFAHKVWDGRWRVVHFMHLQEWQQDNEFLHYWHRPQMPSFRACFSSIFRLHTETGNIWTHLIGFILFVGICIYFLCLPTAFFICEWQEKVVFFLFFLGAVLCLCFSTLFHTMGCHSERVFRIFGKLDYSGIALMIMGSFVPWIYYSFYCQIEPKIIYMSCVCILGILCIVISQWEKFSTAKYRGVRAVLFAALGLSGIVPAVHTMVQKGFLHSVTVGQLGWLILMAVLYLLGAFLYAKRIPERYFPGKCDLWFQSHQIFHILVVLAACVHFHGISNLQQHRLLFGEDCIM